MNFAPKTGPLVAELLSGVVALLFVYFDFHGLSVPEVKLTSGAIILLILIAWVLGTFFDMVRNLFEWCLEYHFPRYKLNWDFFFCGNKDRLENFDHYYWSFYILDADMAIAILLSVIVRPFTKTVAIRWYLWVIWIGVGLLFAFDALLLRCEIRDLLDAEPRRP